MVVRSNRNATLSALSQVSLQHSRVPMTLIPFQSQVSTLSPAQPLSPIQAHTYYIW